MESRHAGVEPGLRLGALLEVSGPDPKQAKALANVFYKFLNGITTVSSSGCLLAGEAFGEHCQLVTTASVILPFLTADARSAPTTADSSSLLPGVRLRVHTTGGVFGAHLLRICALPAATAAAQRLVDTGGLSSAASWAWGWSFGSGLSASSACCMALLKLEARDAAQQAVLDAVAAAACTALQLPASRPALGERCAAVGSPFGALSPAHFNNCVVVGGIANVVERSGWQVKGLEQEQGPTLLLADLRVLPGMEGAPVLGTGGHLLGLLAPPLRQPDSAVELPLVLPTQLLLQALRGDGSAHTATGRGGEAAALPSDKAGRDTARLQGAQPPLLAAQECHARQSQGAGPAACTASMGQLRGSGSAADARRSVVAVSTPSGMWASGVVAHASGIIVTVAHLLRPANAGGSGLPPERVHVRVDAESGLQQWHDARVLHSFTGALDVAIVQLLSPPRGLLPLPLCDAPVLVGQAAWVVGHAVLNPRAQLAPSITSGVVAKQLREPSAVAESWAGPGRQAMLSQAESWAGPGRQAMLVTSCCVWPGASGGAVVDICGHMLGLVTSNTKHSRGGVVPSLNFAIAADLLRPLWLLAAAAGGGAFDRARWQALDLAQPALARLWELGAPPEDRDALPLWPSEDSDRGRAGGARFSQFLRDFGGGTSTTLPARPRPRSAL